MQRRLLIISKDPEFDARDEVVLGQCEPFTSGWSLKMILPGGVQEELLVGTYTDLRRIQESCSQVDEPAAVKKRVGELRALLTAGVGETVAVQLSNGGHAPPMMSQSATVEMRAVPSEGVVPTHTPGGLLNLEPNGGVLIATVVQPERADDANYLKKEFETVVNCRPKAVVMDLGRVPSLSTNSFKELAGIRDRLRQSGANFALCNVAGSMQQHLVKISEPLPVFATQASALAAMKS